MYAYYMEMLTWFAAGQDRSPNSLGASPAGMQPQGTSSQTLIKATRTQLHSNAGPAGTWDPSVDADSDLAARRTRSQIATRRSRPLSG